jgi:hypothetical protein
MHQTPWAVVLEAWVGLSGLLEPVLMASEGLLVPVWVLAVVRRWLRAYYLLVAGQ